MKIAKKNGMENEGEKKILKKIRANSSTTIKKEHSRKHLHTLTDSQLQLRLQLVQLRVKTMA